MPYAAYVICGTPRTGSTLLCDLLRAAGVGAPESYFLLRDADYWAAQWGLGEPALADATFAETFLASMQGEGMGETDIFGLRLMWSSVEDALRVLDAAFGGREDILTRLLQAFGKSLFIHLSRSDKDAQAVSSFARSRAACGTVIAMAPSGNAWLRRKHRHSTPSASRRCVRRSWPRMRRGPRSSIGIGSLHCA